ncbi:MAG: hypothetical protein ACO3N9_11310 [Alphaproteobacteria bacterium]
MLAELAIANAAFGVIKEAIGNGKELYDIASVTAKFFDSKTELQRKAHKNGYKSDLQAFMELEKLREMETHLKEHMIWAGRPGMWDDWLAFQKQAKEEREKREKEEKEKRAYYAQLALYVVYFICGIALFIPSLILLLKFLLG